MNFTIYNKEDGKIIIRVNCHPDQFVNDVGEGQEFYLNCPQDATHIIDNTPVTLVPAVTIERLLVSIRQVRNVKLIESDWTQIPDAPLSSEQKAAWATYRQALRDFPDTCDPTNPAWPTPPK